MTIEELIVIMAIARIMESWSCLGMVFFFFFLFFYIGSLKLYTIWEESPIDGLWLSHSALSCLKIGSSG